MASIDTSTGRQPGSVPQADAPLARLRAAARAALAATVPGLGGHGRAWMARVISTVAHWYLFSRPPDADLRRARDRTSLAACCAS